MTEKENYLKLLKGEHPEWVPFESMSPRPDHKANPYTIMFPGLLSTAITGIGVVDDCFGVTYVPADATGAKIPDPNHHILHDITKWRDVIKAPDLSGIDWESMIKKDKEIFRVNPEESLVAMELHFGYFQYLMAFMGFEDGLCAMFEEPEEVMALFDYLCDFFTDVANRCIDYVKPDVFFMSDDIAAWKDPFISVDMYRELVKPYEARQAKIALDRGLPIMMHCCGRAEDFVGDWIDFGVNLWSPSQTSNNLVAVKEKYGDRIAIAGGWDPTGDLLKDDVTEEYIRYTVRETIDRLAPGGGYAFGGGYMGSFTDEKIKEKNRWIAEEAISYGGRFYK